MIPFDQQLRARLSENLAAHERRRFDLGERRAAAVAVVVVPSDAALHGHDPFQVPPEEMAVLGEQAAGLDGSMAGVAGGAAFVLCRRAAGLNSHARQWALPGGRRDEGESAVDAALRELHEELGILLTERHVVGLLDDYVTRSGYLITPVVLWADEDVEIIPNPEEVTYAYRIGLHHLCRDGSPRFITIPESDRPVVQVPLGGDLIHAPTGAVLVQFRWVAIEGRANERVDHFEQPVFAWR